MDVHERIMKSTSGNEEENTEIEKIQEEILPIESKPDETIMAETPTDQLPSEPIAIPEEPISSIIPPESIVESTPETIEIVEKPIIQIDIPYDVDFPLHSLVKDPNVLLYYITGEKRDPLPTKELILEKFKKRDEVDLEKVDSDGNTALHIAIYEKQEQSAQILIQCGCQVNSQNKSGNTPLLVAVKKNFVWMTNILCNAAVDINICDLEGQSPMEIACGFISLEDKGEGCLPLLSKGADINLMYKKPVVSKIDESKYNEFGFLAAPDKNADDQLMKVYVEEFKEDRVQKDYDKYLKTRKDLLNRESYRVSKFDKMVKRSKYGALDRKFKNRVVKGVPYASHGGVYKVLLPIADLQKKFPGKYQLLLAEKGKPDVLFQIDKDVKRCYQKHKFFGVRFGEYQIKLYNVLKAYSLLNKEVEYCQGMSTIAAILLMFLTEEEAFWGFVHLMGHPDYVIGDLYLPEWPFLLEWYFVFEKLFEKQHQKLYKHIENEGLFTDLYARKWVLCIMLECLPFDVSLRIFDVVVSEGTKILFNVVMGLMKMYESWLLKMSMEKIKIFFQDLCIYPVDADALLQHIMATRVQMKTVLKWKADYVHHAAERKKQHRERERKKQIELEKIQATLGTKPK